MIRSAYLAAEGFETPLEEELARRGVRIDAWHERLALSPDPPVPAVWAQDIWLDPVEIAAPSVKAASDSLRAVQRNWGAYAAAHHRRMALITQRLPLVSAKPLVFPEPAPSSHLGGGPFWSPTVCLPARTNPRPSLTASVTLSKTAPGRRAART